MFREELAELYANSALCPTNFANAYLEKSLGKS